MEDNRTEKRKIGDKGESLACEFLVKQGFEIVEKNYLKKWGEIDIISRKGAKLYFIEVKTVSHLPYLPRQASSWAGVSGVTKNNDQYRPEDNIHPWKLKRLSRVIQTYLLGYRPAYTKGYGAAREVDWQFDVITVYLDPNSDKFEIERLEDVII